MNFLAHALLAGEDPALIVGGVAGDFIKGPLPAGLPPDLARGVALHRAIDSHAERHAAFRRSRARVSAPRRRYAGVLVDIFYDHLLALDWQARHAEPLGSFAARVYRLVEARLPDLAASTHVGLRMMGDEDWLTSYARIDGIAHVLARMSRRGRQPNPLLGADAEFRREPEGFRLDFESWLIDAQAFVAQWGRQVAGDGLGEQG